LLSNDQLSAAVDQFTRCTLATPENTEALTETIRDFDRLPKSERSTASKGNAYFAAAQNISNLTLNHLPGTPTFLLVDQNLQLLDDGLGIRLKQQ